MITYTTSNTPEDLKGILNLQKANLLQFLSQEQSRSQGFVTVSHTYEQLKRLNDIERHVIAKDNGKVVAYVLAMTSQSKADIPILIPMFDMFNKTRVGCKYISDYNYIVVGQTCVDKLYRGQGVFDNCYTAYKNQFENKFDFAVTEIASANARSFVAHARVGFKEMAKYTAADNVEWRIVVWNWKS